MITSFLLFLAAFVAIGLSSSLRARHDKADYYLASRSVKPWLVGLSAVATNNSGYMFIGVIGYTYHSGLASIWLMLGWITGDLIASFLVHGRLRAAMETTQEVSFAGVLNHWSGNRAMAWQRLASLAALFLLMAYAGAQLLAGSKALHVLFDWPLWAGAVIGAVLVAAYCVAGGIRASIWTDAAQSIVMIAAMGLLLVVAIRELGGIDGAIAQMRQVEGFLDWMPTDVAVPGLAGGVLFAVSWLFAGLSVIGQPHVMVRFMTLDDVGGMLRMRVWYYLWFTAFYAMATGVGLLARVHLADPGGFDAELALPTMAVEMLHPVLVGLILAGIFAATMSTADSLVLSCSAAITHDLLPQRIERPIMLKLSTIGITLLALAWALLNEQSVFSLVIMSWSGLACIFGPVILVCAFGGRPSQKQLLLMSATGLATALLWRYLGWHNAMYEGMPGLVAGLAIYGLSRLSPGAATRTHRSAA